MTCSSKKKKKDSSSKRIEPSDDNLNEYFGLSQGQNRQETVDVTPTETPKKSEEVNAKNDPDAEEGTDHLPQKRNNLHDMLKVLVVERSTDDLGAQLVKVHPGLPPNQSNLHNK